VTADQLNQQCIERLRAAALEKRVAVIGSGPSSDYILRIDKLQEKLATRCGVNIDPNEPSWEFCERAHQAKAKTYFEVLQETYEDTPQWSARAYRQLVGINFLGFATLNYDDQLPFDFKCRYKDGRVSVFPPWAVNHRLLQPAEFLSPPPRLALLHGYSHRDNPEWWKQLILKESDYNRHYVQEPRPLFDWWVGLLLTIPCIFIGTSLREPGLERVFKEIGVEHRDVLNHMNHLHLLPAEQDTRTRDYPSAGRSFRTIEQVLYDRLDDRYTGLLQVLSELSGLPWEAPIPNVQAPKLITATDNFDW
jgi:hypothetical protein